MTLPKLTFVLGGAASGKSGFAETHVLAQGGRPVYIATAQAFDTEMKEKIERHRDLRGNAWATVEAPLDIARAVTDAPPDANILIDCATLWLSNLMHNNVAWEDASAALLAVFAARLGQITIVSNEVGHGIVPENRLARQFRGAQGLLNQRLAAQADLVVMVTAGLPMVLKSTHS